MSVMHDEKPDEGEVEFIGNNSNKYKSKLITIKWLAYDIDLRL